MDKIKSMLQKLPFKLNPYIIIIAILVIVIIVSLTGRRSQEATFDAFIDAYTNLDAKAIVDLMPDEYINALVDAGKIDGRYEMVQVVQNAFDYKFGDYYDVSTWSYTYEIVSETSYQKGDKDYEFQKIQQYFGEYGDKIKEVMIIRFDPTITYQNTSGYYDTKALQRNYVTLVKIGQSWYLAEFDDIDNWV